MLEIEGLVDDCTKNEVLAKAVENAQNGDIFVEVGSYLGGSAAFIGQKAVALNKKITLFCIDNWKCDNISAAEKARLGHANYYAAFLENVRRVGAAHLITPLRLDSMVASQKFEDNSIAFLFLDGDHSIPYIEQELEAWLPKVKAGGMIAGHDYSDVTVGKNAREFFGNKIKSTSDGSSYFCIKE